MSRMQQDMEVYFSNITNLAASHRSDIIKSLHIYLQELNKLAIAKPDLYKTFSDGHHISIGWPKKKSSKI